MRTAYALHNTQIIHKVFAPGTRIILPDGGWASPKPGDTWGDWRCDIVADADAIPASKQSTGKAVQIANDVPKWAHTLEDVPPTYATAQEAHEAMIAWADAFNKTVTGPVVADEKIAWVVKEAAARAIGYDLDNPSLPDTATPAQLAMIDAECAITGETREELIDKVIVKADQYRAVVSAVTGLRRKTGVAIDAASDPYQYEAVLDAAQAEAAALAASLGL